MRCRLLTVFLLIAASPVAFASRQADRIVALKTDAGVLLVWNQPGQHFTVELRGESIQPFPGSEHVFFSVDGVIVQIGAVGVKEFGPGTLGRNGSAILAAHRDWEAKSIRERLGAPIDIQSTEVELGALGKGLLWSYDMPRGFDDEAKQQVYLTVLSKQFLVFFNGVVTATASEERVRQVLVATASTLQVKRARIDVDKLQKRLLAR
ncbi:MAG: hypothetical protein AB9873_06120 [Syntrophobacteraceae bacterium]